MHASLEVRCFMEKRTAELKSHSIQDWGDGGRTGLKGKGGGGF